MGRPFLLQKPQAAFGMYHGHVWWLPGNDEPMPLTAWESRRGGIDDYRYLQMIEKYVTTNRGDPLTIEADAWLQALRDRLADTDPHDAVAGNPLPLDEYDQLRAKAAGYIENLGTPTDTSLPSASKLHRSRPWCGNGCRILSLNYSATWSGCLQESNKLDRH